MNIKEWRDKYRNEKIVNVKEELTNQELSIIEMLEILVQDKVYTEYEYDCLKMDIAEYYKDDDMDEEELEYTKSLEEKGVSRKDYNNLLKTFNKIDEKYEDKFNKISA